MHSYHRGLLLIGAALTALPLTASAWSHGKPGLWEVTSNMKFGAGGPQIPPDQLEKMKAMGIKIPGAEPITNQICVTPEQAAMEKPQQPSGERNCEMQNFKKDGSSWSGDMVCKGGMQGSGHFQATYSNDEAYNGSMQFKGTSRHGPTEMNNEFSGKWLSADCGAVKPFKSE